MEKNDTAVKICGTTEGRLPGSCAPLAFPYVPVQCDNPARYSQQDALQAGTLFPGLNLPFNADMETRFPAANTALSELMALGVPAILVPSPNVTNHHQEKNAAVLGEHGAALVLPEEGLDGKRLFTEAAALLRDETRLAAMHEASLRLGVRDATERIYETVMALVK